VLACDSQRSVEKPEGAGRMTLSLAYFWALLVSSQWRKVVSDTRWSSTRNMREVDIFC